MGYWLNRNSRNRTNIHPNDFEGIKFRVLFPKYDDWKTKLLANNIPVNQLSEEEFITISGASANTYLKYDTDVKNLQLIVFHFKRLYKKRIKEQKIYDIDILTTRDSNQESEGKAFIGDNDLDGNYSDNSDTKTTGRSKQTESILSNYDKLMEIANEDDPTSKFIYRLISEIAYPYQPYQEQNNAEGI